MKMLYSHFATKSYVKALYKEGSTEPVAYQYIYNYTDHLGNIRLSYALDDKTGEVKTLEENHYYPFGLKHSFYNKELYEIALKQQAQNEKEVKQTVKKGYNYKYQGQERQDELNLNWDSFKYRNYDYAIGRFMSIDPLAEKYTYNSTYAFQENKMGLGRELEGLELARFINGAKKFVMGLFQAKQATENDMYDPNTNMRQQEQETTNPETEHVASMGEANQNIQEGGENMVKGAVQGTADTITEVSDNSALAAETITVAYPPVSEVTIPFIAVCEGVSTTSTAISASVDISDGNMDAAIDKIEGLAINQVFSTAGKKVGNVVTKSFKPNESVEKNITKNTINIISDWFSRTFQKIYDIDTFLW